MSTLRIFGSGFRAALFSPRLWLSFYLCNLAFSSAIAYAFHRALAGSAAAASLDPLFSDFDLTLVGDFLNHHGETIAALMGLVLPLGILSVVVYAILSGGALAVLHDREPVEFPGLLESSGRLALRCLRLVLLSAVLTGLVFILMVGIGGAVVALVVPAGGSEVTSVTATGIAVLAGAFVVMAAVMVGDYARVLMVVDDDRSMLPEMWKSVRFLIKHAGGTMGLQLLFVLLNVGTLLLYLVMEGQTWTGSGLLVALLVVIQQILMLVRAILRVGLLAGQLGFTSARRVQPAAEASAI